MIRERTGRLEVDCCWDEFREANVDLFSSPPTFLERWYPAGAAFTADAKTAIRLPEEFEARDGEGSD